MLSCENIDIDYYNYLFLSENLRHSPKNNNITEETMDNLTLDYLKNINVEHLFNKAMENFREYLKPEFSYIITSIIPHDLINSDDLNKLFFLFQIDFKRLTLNPIKNYESGTITEVGITDYKSQEHSFLYSAKINNKYDSITIKMSENEIFQMNFGDVAHCIKYYQNRNRSVKLPSIPSSNNRNSKRSSETSSIKSNLSKQPSLFSNEILHNEIDYLKKSNNYYIKEIDDLKQKLKKFNRFDYVKKEDFEQMKNSKDEEIRNLILENKSSLSLKDEKILHLSRKIDLIELSKIQGYEDYNNSFQQFFLMKNEEINRIERQKEEEINRIERHKEEEINRIERHKEEEINRIERQKEEEINRIERQKEEEIKEKLNSILSTHEQEKEIKNKAIDYLKSMVEEKKIEKDELTKNYKDVLEKKEKQLTKLEKTFKTTLTKIQIDHSVLENEFKSEIEEKDRKIDELGNMLKTLKRSSSN